MSEKIEKIRERVLRYRPALIISRIPERTLKEFKQIADEEFSSDYGMTLKWLLDNSRLYVKLLEMEERLNILEKKNPEEKVIKTLDGKEVRTDG